MELAVSDRVQTEGQRSERITNLLRKTEERILGYEKKLSRFIKDNELYRLNHSQGRWFEASNDLAEVLRTAQSAFTRSAGLFNPFMGTKIVSMGYDRSFEDMSRTVIIGQSGSSAVREESEISALGYRKGVSPNNQSHLPLSNIIPLHWSESLENTVELFPGYEVDLGGIAKGWIVERGARHLIENGVHDFVIDAGGDMVCSGTDEGRPWTVGIENPVVSGNALVLDIESTSIATSGTYKRKWQLEGRDVHHIIDPRTSWSAKTDIVSSSVLHQSLTEAEWMAKTALIKGSQLGIEWLGQQNSRGWVVVLKNGEVKHAWM